MIDTHIRILLLSILLLFSCQEERERIRATKKEVPQFRLKFNPRSIINDLEDLSPEIYRYLLFYYREYNEFERKVYLGYNKGKVNFEKETGLVIVVLSPETNKVLSVNYKLCIFPGVIAKETVEQIINKMIDLDIVAFKMDPKDNIYFSVDRLDKYQYAIVRDSASLMSGYSYYKKFDNCYKMKANFD